jgi:hypothetical protein
VGEKLFAIGVYDEVGPAAARAARDAAKVQLREGRDPVKARLVDRRRTAVASASSFFFRRRDVARKAATRM